MRAAIQFIHLAGLVLAMMAGCAVGPNYLPPAERVPPQWNEAGQHGVTTRPAVSDRWWLAFGDSVLNDLVERAIRSNLELKMAEARVRQARSERLMCAAEFWPKVDVSGSYVYEGKSLNKKPQKAGESALGRFRDTVVKEGINNMLDGDIDPAGFATDVMKETLSDALTRKSGGSRRPQARNLFEAGFDASWEIDVFGAVRRRVEAAEAETEAAEEERRTVLVTLLSEVARNYVEARGFQQQIRILNTNIGVQEETLRLTRLQYEGEVASELDVVQAQAQVSSTKSRVSALQTSLRHAVHRISLLIGGAPDAALADFAAEAPIPAAPPEIPVGLPSELLRRRPDIRRSERMLAVATARIGVATAELFPRFSLTGSFGTETHDMRSFLNGQSLAWSVGPSVSWPIWDAGRIRANIEAQGASQQQALDQYELVVLRALKEVEDALVAYQNEHVRYRHLTEAVEAYRRAVSLARIQYNEGMSDFLVVMDSERSLCKVEDELVQSRTETTLYAIAVLKSLGGGWEICDGLANVTRP